MTFCRRLAIRAAKSFANAFLISLHLRWIAQGRRTIREWRREPRGTDRPAAS